MKADLSSPGCTRRCLLTLALLVIVATAGHAPAAATERQQVVNSVGMALVLIEPGTFERGSPPEETGRRPNETRHAVTLTRGFWLGATEVTQAQWDAIMPENPSAFPGPDRPVENVAWFDWLEFCNRLSIREGLTPAYTLDGVHVTWRRDADGYRLPTEAEWEYACRAGTRTRFNAGDRSSELLEVAWVRANADWQTHPVATRPANPWGLHDMHGNVFEWCWDLYEPFGDEALVDPAGAADGWRRVLRGGGWTSHSRASRSAYRHAGDPSARRAWYGARLARSAVGN